MIKSSVTIVSLSVSVRNAAKMTVSGIGGEG